MAAPSSTNSEITSRSDLKRKSSVLPEPQKPQSPAKKRRHTIQDEAIKLEPDDSPVSPTLPGPDRDVEPEVKGSDVKLEAEEEDLGNELDLEDLMAAIEVELSFFDEDGEAPQRRHYDLPSVNSCPVTRVNESQVKTFQRRIRHIVSVIMQCAREEKKLGIGRIGCLMDQKFVRILLNNKNVDNLVERMLAGIPLHIQSILGVDKPVWEDLAEQLPTWDWKHCKGWGVYCNFVYCAVIDKLRGYVGSGTGMEGICQRFKGYQAIIRRAFPATASTAHERQISDPQNSVNFRQLAYFPEKPTRFLVLVLEAALMVYLGCVSDRLEPHKYFPEGSHELIRAALGGDIPDPNSLGLNRALPIKQRLYEVWPDTKDLCCANCGRTKKDLPNERFAYFAYPELAAKSSSNAPRWCQACYITLRKINFYEGDGDIGLNSCEVCHSQEPRVCRRAVPTGPKWDDFPREILEGRLLCMVCCGWARRRKNDRPPLYWDNTQVWPCSDCGATRAPKMEIYGTDTWTVSRDGKQLRCYRCQRYKSGGGGGSGKRWGPATREELTTTEEELFIPHDHRESQGRRLTSIELPNLQNKAEPDTGEGKAKGKKREAGDLVEGCS
ncbi:hypothetical protein MMC10_004183 [Thelotrema lepadinum]|nr:hypothetical protein [Thelotrema lepadinum]